MLLQRFRRPPQMLPRPRCRCRPQHSHPNGHIAPQARPQRRRGRFHVAPRLNKKCTFHQRTPFACMRPRGIQAPYHARKRSGHGYGRIRQNRLPTSTICANPTSPITTCHVPSSRFICCSSKLLIQASAAFFFFFSCVEYSSRPNKCKATKILILGIQKN